MREKLNSKDRIAALKNLPDWHYDQNRDCISRQYVFKNFVEAFGFMAQVALVSEKIDHHPEWSNVYRTVEVTLLTHSANGLTELDIKLATAMDKIANLG